MNSHRLGAFVEGNGIRFRVYSRHARKVWLSLLQVDPALGVVEVRRLPMPAEPGFLWSLHVPDCQPGQHYGYRMDGPYAPDDGHYFNPACLLLDPYAIRVHGDYHWHTDALTHSPEHAQFDSDTLSCVPHAIVPEALDSRADTCPRTPWEDTIIYETHVKGLTQLNHEVPEAQRGRYLGVSSACMLEYYRHLGITAIQLLPVHFAIDELHLWQQQRRNYWGYNPLAFFAPSPRYALHNPVVEFRLMVDQLHAAGIEVLLDVVFNHTAEGDERGPTLSLRGLDNATYYRRSGEGAFVYSNESGCGNALNTDQPAVLQLIMDCLRFWACDMGVDGFRFDLASVLSRRNGVFDSGHAIWASIMQDPVLRERKWIVEPWDIGHGGYQLGHYPEGFSEWNDLFRDNLRRYVRGEEGQLGNFAKRFAGSWDVFRKAGTGARASINFVTAHDGFTLRDLVSYNTKHNEANGEHNRDGAHENFSDNGGVEGDTGDALIMRNRLRQQCNFIALLGWAQGVPMLLHGDEGGRTQHGNNNAYCQDNAVAWCVWPLPQPALRDFTAEVLRLRRYFQLGHVYLLHHSLWQQINHRFHFYRPDGHRMSYDDWMQSYARSICIEIHAPQQRVLLLVNMHSEPVIFSLPAVQDQREWQRFLDTDQFADTLMCSHAAFIGPSLNSLEYRLAESSVALLAETNPISSARRN